jgi:polysaccharide pyruvyl transferase WcaK-like protein
MAGASSVAATATGSAPRAGGARSGKVRIAQVGTFDVENLGDLLFPILARRALADRLPGVEIALYSYRSKSADEWPFEVRPLGALVAEVADYDLVLVGGGDIIRFDKEVAPDYRPSDSGLHHPTSLWMAPTLLAAAHQIPVVWNAVGVPADCPGWAVPAMRSVLSAVTYLAVRDQRSAERLRAVGSDAHVRVVADTAFAVRELLPPEPSAAYRSELEELGIAQPYIVMQPSPRLRPFASRLEESLRELQQDGWSILELPVGPIHGDSAGSLGLDIETRTPSMWPHPELAIELIGRSRGAIGVSMHLAIVAAALGVPVARPADLTRSESKHVAIELLPGVSQWPSSASGSISLPFGTPRAGNGSGPDAQIRSLDGHWEEVASTVERKGRLEPLIDYVLAVPGQLEEAARESAEGIELYRELYEKQAGLLAAQEHSLASEREERARLSTRLAGREEEHQALVADWTARQFELDRLRESVEEAQRQATELTAQVASLNEERHNLTELLEARRADLETLRARLTASQTAAAELAEAQALVERLTTERAQMTELFQGTQADRARLTARLGELERAHAELVRSAAETEEWLRRLEGSRSWRITTPFRAVAGAFRRAFKPARLDDEPPQHE